MSVNLEKLVSLADEYTHELPPTPSKLSMPVGAAIAGWIDQLILKPDAKSEQVRKLCAEVRQVHFETVYVNPAYVSLCAELLDGSGEGSPFGATFPETRMATYTEVGVV
jgi:deoxyribose-phosphate aldolase